MYELQLTCVSYTLTVCLKFTVLRWIFCRISASEDGFTSYACFVCVLLSHFTEDDELIGINGAGIKLSFLIDLFKGGNCETLKGKPKVFLMEVIN